MATRIPTRDELVTPAPDPKALVEFRKLVDALPDALDAWQHVNAKGNVVPVPAVMAFWEKVGLSAFLGAQAVWPDRELFWKWLINPCRSLAGPGGPPTTYESYGAFLAARRETEAGR